MVIATELIVAIIIFALAQIMAFIIFVVRFNIKFETWKAKFETEMMEMRTDIEDHKLAFEKRFTDFDINFSKKQDDFCHDNNAFHSAIMKEIGYVKEVVFGIRESIGEMRGILETHISAGNGHDTVIKRKRPPSKR